MDARRVVTGHDAEGKAVFVSDDLVAGVTLTLLPGAEFHRLWGADSTRTFPDDGSRPDDVAYFPPVGGFRFGFFTIPPDGGNCPQALTSGPPSKSSSRNCRVWLTTSSPTTRACTRLPPSTTASCCRAKPSSNWTEGRR